GPTVPVATVPPVPELIIRPAEFSDLDAMYAICVRTGAAGDDATHLYKDPDLLGHIYAGPYVMVDPGFGFVVTADGVVVGYAVATDDTAEFEAECEESWWPALRRRYPDVTALPGEDSDA